MYQSRQWYFLYEFRPNFDDFCYKPDTPSIHTLFLLWQWPIVATFFTRNQARQINFPSCIYLEIGQSLFSPLLRIEWARQQLMSQIVGFSRTKGHQFPKDIPCPPTTITETTRNGRNNALPPSSYKGHIISTGDRKPKWEDGKRSVGTKKNLVLYIKCFKKKIKRENTVHEFSFLLYPTRANRHYIEYVLHKLASGDAIILPLTNPPLPLPFPFVPSWTGALISWESKNHIIIVDHWHTAQKNYEDQKSGRSLWKLKGGTRPNLVGIRFHKFSPV